MTDMPMEKKIEKGLLNKSYRAGKKKQREEVLARSDENFVRVISWLQDSAGTGDGKAIIGLAESWAQHLDEEQRLFLLGEIDNATMRVRVNRGLDEMSDPLPPDDSVFTKCRELLR